MVTSWNDWKDGHKKGVRAWTGMEMDHWSKASLAHMESHWSKKGWISTLSIQSSDGVGGILYELNGRRKGKKAFV